MVTCSTSPFFANIATGKESTVPPRSPFFTIIYEPDDYQRQAGNTELLFDFDLHTRDDRGADDYIPIAIYEFGVGEAEFVDDEYGEKHGRVRVGFASYTAQQVMIGGHSGILLWRLRHPPDRMWNHAKQDWDYGKSPSVLATTAFMRDPVNDTEQRLAELEKRQTEAQLYANGLGRELAKLREEAHEQANIHGEHTHAPDESLRAEVQALRDAHSSLYNHVMGIE